MSTPFISYYEHIAKLAQVANKQTVFLAHILHEMEFDHTTHQYFVDMSQYRKMQIMKKVSPDVQESKLLNLANQYMSKLKKADLIRNVARGMWLVNPECYGKYRMVSKSLRTENATIYATAVFDKDELISTTTVIDSPENGEAEEVEIPNKENHII